MGAPTISSSRSTCSGCKAILSRLPRAGDLQARDRRVARDAAAHTAASGRCSAVRPRCRTVYDQIGRVAPTAATVLLIGESGTGKEVAAQTLHELSLRRKHSFIAVNCGAISPNLIESEMFGHERGSFTGAERQHKGYFERANGGTLFLDEITEMPLELQVKLLRVLETGMFMRVGTTKETRPTCASIAATNRDPEQAVLEGKLREDLYHRLNVFPINLPPLRERGDDVELLAQAFLDELNAERRHDEDVPAGRARELASYNWPGNVRELKNYVQRAYIIAGDGFGQHGGRAAADVAVDTRRPDGGDDPVRHVARRSRPSADPRDARSVRRREDARGGDARHQLEDALQPARGIRGGLSARGRRPRRRRGTRVRAEGAGALSARRRPDRQPGRVDRLRAIRPRRWPVRPCRRGSAARPGVRRGRHGRSCSTPTRCSGPRGSMSCCASQSRMMPTFSARAWS